ncbi:hypothetical protein WMY93_012553 [Mugilogobius chulae]|uniref:Uncharacterized protein n=1 Tax=Mugilogobius chulae TaxID=88201 RepID=A0AAW0P1J9_9GOBI
MFHDHKSTGLVSPFFDRFLAPVCISNRASGQRHMTQTWKIAFASTVSEGKSQSPLASNLQTPNPTVLAIQGDGCLHCSKKCRMYWKTAGYDESGGIASWLEDNRSGRRGGHGRGRAENYSAQVRRDAGGNQSQAAAVIVPGREALLWAKTGQSPAHNTGACTGLCEDVVW